MADVMGSRALGRREAARWALLAYLVTVAVTRGITTALHLRGAGTSGGILIAGVHVHHLVFGLVVLAAAGLVLIAGRSAGTVRRWHAIAWGVGWALVLDELALLINLRDVSWAPLGDESLVGLAVMGGVLAWLAWRPERAESSEVS